MSLKSVRAEKGRLQGEDLLSERIEVAEEIDVEIYDEVRTTVQVV